MSCFFVGNFRGLGLVFAKLGGNFFMICLLWKHEKADTRIILETAGEEERNVTSRFITI